MTDTPLILGAGPAGISCAHYLARAQQKVTVWEKHTKVGGLARTDEFQGFRFDVGPHRFFTKNDMIHNLWCEVTGEDLVHVPRLTRIHYAGQLFKYPLQPLEAFAKLGPATSSRAMLTYAWAQATRRPSTNFEEWVMGQFGSTLYEIFFKHYTEKVWGIPCARISCDWATQRIKGLNLGSTILHALLPFLNRRGHVKSLIDAFVYPRLGAGQTYEKMAAEVAEQGNAILLGREVTRIFAEKHRLTALEYQEQEQRSTEDVPFLFSSMPITALIQQLTPPPPVEVLQAAQRLYYRAHLCVNVIVDQQHVFPDNWIYVHSPDLRCARIANYGNFSQDMLGDTSMSGIALEYFCFQHDTMWQMNDDALIKLAVGELEKLGFTRAKKVVAGFVTREADSYPAYFLEYQSHLEIIRRYVEQFDNLLCIGRGGMYRYNNQDHAMLSGVLAARNFLGEQHNLWEINIDEAYLEEKSLASRDEWRMKDKA